VLILWHRGKTPHSNILSALRSPKGIGCESRVLQLEKKLVLRFLFPPTKGCSSRIISKRANSQDAQADHVISIRGEEKLQVWSHLSLFRKFCPWGAQVASPVATVLHNVTQKRVRLHDAMKILICLSRSHDRRRSTKMKFSEPCMLKLMIVPKSIHFPRPTRSYEQWYFASPVVVQVVATQLPYVFSMITGKVRSCFEEKTQLCVRAFVLLPVPD
jgi:hypothetical protein